MPSILGPLAENCQVTCACSNRLLPWRWGAGLLASDRLEIERPGSADPDRAVAVIAQLIAGVRMHEHVERIVVQREPGHDFDELRRRERKLVAPSRMRPDRTLVKATELDAFAKVGGQHVPEGPCDVAAGGVKIDVGVPADDAGNIERRYLGQDRSPRYASSEPRTMNWAMGYPATSFSNR